MGGSTTNFSILKARNWTYFIILCMRFCCMDTTFNSFLFSSVRMWPGYIEHQNCGRWKCVFRQLALAGQFKHWLRLCLLWRVPNYWPVGADICSLHNRVRDYCCKFPFINIFGLLVCNSTWQRLAIHNMSLDTSTRSNITWRTYSRLQFFKLSIS